MTINPQVIQKDGKNEFVVLPYNEFVEIQSQLEDYEDLRDLRAAKAESEDEPGLSLDEVAKALQQ